MTTLAPIRKTVIAGRECWGAETTDGEWQFVRSEDGDTPWLIRHRPSVRDRSYELPVMLLGTLRACQVAVADGSARVALKELKEEEALIR